MAQSLMFLSQLFALMAVLFATGILPPPPVEKIGLPLYWRDVRWTFFILFNLKRMEILKDNEHFLVRGKKRNYVITFNESWLFFVYEGNDQEEIWNRYSLGGQSNKADYLTFWQKWIGKKIENYYLTRYGTSKHN